MGGRSSSSCRVHVHVHVATGSVGKDLHLLPHFQVCLYPSRHHHHIIIKNLNPSIKFPPSLVALIFLVYIGRFFLLVLSAFLLCTVCGNQNSQQPSFAGHGNLECSMCIVSQIQSSTRVGCTIHDIQWKASFMSREQWYKLGILVLS